MIAPVRNKPTMTLRERRSAAHKCLEDPIYITAPGALVVLLRNAPWNILPREYQARSLEEAYHPSLKRGHDQPRESKKRYRAPDLSPTMTESTTARISRPLPKRRRIAVPSPKTFVRTIWNSGKKRRVESSPPSTPSSIASPPLYSPSHDVLRRSARVHIPLMHVPQEDLLNQTPGTRVATNAGLFSTTARRIRVLQRGKTFVWIIGTANRL